MRTLLLGAITAAVLLAGTAAAGNYTPPPGDYAASWVTNTLLLIGGPNLVDLTTGEERPFTVPGVKVAGPVIAASVVPLIAFVANGNLAVAAPDGTQLRVLASGGAP